jgi:ferric-dicitrate binding protein FerR (iron transport regulator)
MDSKRTFRVPDFIVHENGQVAAMSDREIQDIERLLDAASSFKYAQTNVDQQWLKFTSNIGVTMQVSKRPRKFGMFRWVAAAIVILTIGLGFWHYNNPNQNNAIMVLQSKANLIKKKLTDGTEVLLNKGTVLEIKSLSKQSRVLELKTGEAFFSVVHNDVPFILITDKGIVTVTGTEFDVKHTVNEPFSIYLKKGSIQFETNNKIVSLLPGDYLEEIGLGDFKITRISDSRASVWMDGNLSFDNTLLSEMVKVLEETYKVKFKYDESLSNEKLTITFAGLNAEQAAELLGKTLNSSVSIQ